MAKQIKHGKRYWRKLQRITRENYFEEHIIATHLQQRVETLTSSIAYYRRELDRLRAERGELSVPTATTVYAPVAVVQQLKTMNDEFGGLSGLGPDVVRNNAMSLGFYEAAEWIDNNQHQYQCGVLGMFEAEPDSSIQAKVEQRLAAK